MFCAARYVFARFLDSLTAISYDEVKNKDNFVYTRTITTFLALYLFGLFYQLVLAWDALRLKNTIQVIGLGLYNVGLLLYAAVQAEQIHTAIDKLTMTMDEDSESVWENMRPYLLAIPSVIGVGTLLLAIVAWRLYDEFSWSIYKHISADLAMRKRYLTFQVIRPLLLFVDPSLSPGLVS